MTDEPAVTPRTPSGFPEWLPAEALVLQGIIDRIRQVYERFGYGPIETPSVELPEVLQAKGALSHQIFGLMRPNLTAAESRDADLWLRWDLTVPLARYVAEHYHDLRFPFRRYQIQKVWRGERPQRGRFREFYQCDVDIIGDESLPLLADAEVLAVSYEAIAAIGAGDPKLRVNNLKLLHGFLDSEGFTGQEGSAILQSLRKVDRKDADAAARQLMLDHGMSKAGARQLLDRLRPLPADSFASEIEDLADSPVAVEGYSELAVTVQHATTHFGIPAEHVIVDLGIIRGLDYYTGTVFEVTLADREDLGVIGAGGRYDNLATKFIDRQLPGVGLSIGLTRLFSELVKSGLVETSTSTPAEVLVGIDSMDHAGSSIRLAQHLRRGGIRTELYCGVEDLERQARSAARRGVLVFVAVTTADLDQDTAHLRNVRTGRESVCTGDGLLGSVAKELEIARRTRQVGL
jgi:histidyl-tRNA synthetase